MVKDSNGDVKAAGWTSCGANEPKEVERKAIYKEDGLVVLVHWNGSILYMKKHRCQGNLGLCTRTF